MQDSSDGTTTLTQQIIKLTIILVAISSLCLGFRLFKSGAGSMEGGDQLWRFSSHTTVWASQEEAVVKIYPPIDTQHIHTIQRNIIHPNFRIKNQLDKKTSQRSILAIATEEKKQEITIEFLLHLSQTPFVLSVSNQTKLSTEEREIYLLNTENLQIESNEVQDTLKRFNHIESTQSVFVDNVYNWLKSLPVSSAKDELDVPIILSKKKITAIDSALALVALCRASGIPSRLVSGIILKDELNPTPHYWAEIYHDDQWFSYDVHFGYKQSVPVNFLPMRRNGLHYQQVLKGQLIQSDIDLEQEFESPYIKKTGNTGYISILDLSRLSLDIRNQLAILLLLPLGALITALCRHMIGVQSYGVFTPTLLALAIVYTDLITTAVIFITVIALAYAGRSFFPATITRTPRLAIIFTLVTVILAISVSILEFFDINQGGEIILLPVIILTTLVDRFYKTIETTGIKIAMRRLIWTVVIAILCLPVIQYESLGHILLRYPEVHLTTLAAFLLISIYRGKKLIELPLLRLLAEPTIPTIKNRKSKSSDSNYDL